MTLSMCKAVMTRSKTHNKYQKEKSEISRRDYVKQKKIYINF